MTEVKLRTKMKPVDVKAVGFCVKTGTSSPFLKFIGNIHHLLIKHQRGDKLSARNATSLQM